jgi:hypothetical protein
MGRRGIFQFIMQDYDGLKIKLYCGTDDGGIKRGDRADTGDEEAGHEEGVGRGGSGVPGGDGGATGHVTGATDSLAESTSGVTTSSSDAVRGDDTLDDLYITDASDPSLGLTNVPENPPSDWAANTGPTRTPEAAQEGIEAAPLEPAKEPPRYREAKKKKPKKG